MSATAWYDGYYHASAECWSVYTEVLGVEYSNAVLWGQVHQLTVDTYAVQHAGGPHPDKSVGIHLSGLYLVLDRGVRPPLVPPVLQRLAATIKVWPHFPPPESDRDITIWDVAVAASPQDHADTVRKWARQVWVAWTPYHANIAALVTRHASACPTANH